MAASARSSAASGPRTQAGAGAPASRVSAAAAQVDVRVFLDVNDRLRAAFAELGHARLSAAQRSRWRRRLVDITVAATADLERACGQLDRYEADFQREIS